MGNAQAIVTSNDSEVVAGTSAKGSAEVKPPSHIVLPRLSGDSDPRTRRKNQDLLLRQIRRLRGQVKDLRKSIKSN